MEANVVYQDRRAVIRLGGRFDFNAHREFREAADAAMGRQDVREVHVDMNNVVYLDSSALGMLLMLRDKAKSAQKELALANCGGNVRQVLDIANFTKLFRVV
ncbi:MAG: STAS domain-containing protein [Rhodocyclaceae bacterium]|nr:STAS domain-containing protein [Rhodocyclaceae bacterium]MBX3669284.1 STAS domain-containing protein [Rhodocyclaceae bacterium]